MSPSQCGWSRNGSCASLVVHEPSGPHAPVFRDALVNSMHRCSLRRRLILPGLILGVLAVAATARFATAAPTASPAAETAASPGQVAAQRRLDLLWPQVLAETARPATWAGRRVSHATFAAAARHSSDERTEILNQQVAALEIELRNARAVGRAGRGDGGCWGSALRNCRPLAGGRLTSEDGAINLLWQAQRGFTPEQGMLGGVVVREQARRGAVVIAWSFEGYDWQAPRLVEYRDHQFLVISGRRGGIGGGNADLLYRRDGTAWREIDIDRWKGDLRARLPFDIDVMKAVDYDFARMEARMSLWQLADARCCPTGGEAVARLDLDGDRLVLRDLRRITTVELPASR